MAYVMPKESTELVEGTLERIFFESKETGFVIGRLNTGNLGIVSIKGTLLSPSLGLVLSLKGRWERNIGKDGKDWGMQFIFSEAHIKLPTNVEGIRNYLSATFDGVGPATADKIIAAFGEQSLEIIENYPDRLAGLLGPKLADKIRKTATDNKYSKETMTFLMSLGISAALAGKIYGKFSGETENKVRENPYILTEVKGIGFNTADKIARTLGIPEDSPLRLKAAIMYCLDNTTKDGHVNFPAADLLRETEDLLRCDPMSLVTCFEELVKEGKIIVEQDRAYIRWMAMVENRVAQRLREMTFRTFSLGVTHSEIDKIATERGIELSKTQKEAVLASTQNHISVVTGGPGTGKTTILQITVRALKDKGLKVLLAAPTGRAAKRMAETSGFEASTIHRLLEYVPGQGPKKNEFAPIDAHFIVIDEVSMVDVSLMYHLLNAMSPHTAILFVGDKDQLPSVGPGNVLGDMIASGVVPTVHLDIVFRQAKESLICINAHLINAGEMPRTATQVSDKNDFQIIEESNPEEILKKISGLIRKDIAKDWDPMKDVQCLVPMREGPVSVKSLNESLRALLNPKGQKIKGDRFRVGDKVMQIRNDYNKEVFNGDVGFVEEYDKENDTLYVDFNNDRMPIQYTSGELEDLVLAYACTIHKSQGSEYPVVIMPLTTQHYMLLRRNLIYTGVTRGKKLVVLIGDPKAVRIAVTNKHVQERQTFLQQKLTGNVPIQQISIRPEYGEDEI
jgi:exodeoxyribonuclease V alpha subunit